MREYHIRNAARNVAKAKAWRQANPERARENGRRNTAVSRERHRERILERRRLVREQEKQALLELKASMGRSCDECGAPIEPHRKMDAQFCSDECQRRVSHRRYRARNRGAFVETVHPLVVLERGDSACGICGEDVDLDDFHIDHIIPLARGGLHNYENTQPAHPRCNWAKSARLPDEVFSGVTGARY